MSRVNVKVERRSTFSIFSTFHTLSLFHLHANFTCVHKLEVMYERPHLNVKVERGSNMDYPWFNFCFYV